MGERDPLGGALGGLDAREPRRGEHVALAGALADAFEGGRRDVDHAAGDALTVRDLLVTHVHHPGAPAGIEMGQVAHDGPAPRSVSESHSCRSWKTSSRSGSLKISCLRRG